MKKLLALCFLLISCGKKVDLVQGLDGTDAISQQESLWLSNGSSCDTAGMRLPSMLSELCFTYVNPALRIHPYNGSCQTGTVLYTQNITTSIIGTPLIVPETGTNFSASAINQSTTFLYLSRNSGCGYVRAIRYNE